MHGLMPQLPVVRHARAVGPVPSTATAAALFNVEVGRKHGGRKKKLVCSRQCIVTAQHLARHAFGAKADAPSRPLNFSVHEMPTGTQGLSRPVVQPGRDLGGMSCIGCERLPAFGARGIVHAYCPVQSLLSMLTADNLCV